VGRTLLSAAFDFDLEINIFKDQAKPDLQVNQNQIQGRRTRVSAPHNQQAKYMFGYRALGILLYCPKI
jgi:hypothetical protein